MGQSSPLWSKSVSNRTAFKKRTFAPWKIKAMVASAILAGFGYLHYHNITRTQGLLAQTRTWLSSNVKLTPEWKQVSTWIHHTLPLVTIPHVNAATVAQNPTTTPQWRPPFAKATIVEGFGWHGTGQKATFSRGVMVKVSAHRTAYAGIPSGRVIKIGQVHGHASIEMQSHSASNPIDVTVQGLSRVFVKTGARVTQHTRIGLSGSSPIFVEVSAHGLPIDPLSKQFFGAAWARP